MKFIMKRTIHERIISELLKRGYYDPEVAAIVLTLEEYNELGTLPRGARREDPLAQRSIEYEKGRFSVAGIPVFLEGEMECPE